MMPERAAPSTPWPLSQLETELDALFDTPQTDRLAQIIFQIRRLADQAQAAGLAHVDQTAHSLACFLENQREWPLDESDGLQVRLLMDKLRHHDAPPHSAAVALTTAIAPSEATSNTRVALFIESRALAALLQEALQQAGFSPQLLPSLQALGQCNAQDYPAAVIADLALCQRDGHAHGAIAALRQRFVPAPHLFCMASADDFAARLEAVRLGATRFLKKPLQVQTLIAILRGVTLQTLKAPFRVLFVDDDAMMTSLYSEALVQAGCVVKAVNDPFQATAVVAAFAPDVIVTDLYMPGCNGLELAAVLRQDESLADTPLLFLSSETDRHWQLAALDLGADDFLSKPVPLAVLSAAVIARAKRARMLKRSRREYQQITEHLQRIELAIDRHSIVSIGDLQGSIVYVNQRFCDVSGYSATELLGRNHRIIKSNQHPPEFYHSMWETLCRGRTWHGEVCNRRKDGSHYWVESTITPQLDDEGMPVRYISVRTDITPLKELQAQLMVAKAEAEAASQAKSTFLAHMSHELKTPLNSILGFSQIMLADTIEPPSPDQTEMLEAIERAGRHLLTLISDLVDLAKIETGHMGLEMQACALPSLVRECFSLLKPQGQKRGIAWAFEQEEEEAFAWADRIRLKQVMLNLLSNAIKYNCDKGRVTVSLSRHGENWHIAVRDTGPGIPLNEQPSLFLPFSRLRATALQVEGTGIGLSLSKNLMERMNGQIGVISQPGEGSVFWIEIPAAEPEVC